MENRIDNETEEKLRSFKKIVLSEAQKKSEKEIDSVEKQSNETIEQKETEYLSQAYEAIQEKIRKIRRESSEKVLQADVEARRGLLKAREEIIGKVFSEAADRVSDFRTGEKYAEWLENKIKKGLSELGEGKISASLSQSDEKCIPMLREKFPEIEFSLEPDGDVPGGVRMNNADMKTAVDYTFETTIAAERSKFLQTGGLAINE